MVDGMHKNNEYIGNADYFLLECTIYGTHPYCITATSWARLKDYGYGLGRIKQDYQHRGQVYGITVPWDRLPTPVASRVQLGTVKP